MQITVSKVPPQDDVQYFEFFPTESFADSVAYGIIDYTLKRTVIVDVDPDIIGGKIYTTIDTIDLRELTRMCDKLFGKGKDDCIITFTDRWAI